MNCLPILFFFSKILAHLGSLKEDQIGLEPLQLPMFFNMQTSKTSQWKYWLFSMNKPTKQPSCACFFSVVDTPTYICAHPDTEPQIPVWKPIFRKAFSEGSHCQTFQNYKKGDFEDTRQSRKLLTNLRQLENDSFLRIRIYISHNTLSGRVLK